MNQHEEKERDVDGLPHRILQPYQDIVKVDVEGRIMHDNHMDGEKYQQCNGAEALQLKYAHNNLLRGEEKGESLSISLRLTER